MKTNAVKKKTPKSTGVISTLFSLLVEGLQVIGLALLRLAERRLNHYGKLSWPDIEFLLTNAGKKEGSYLVTECVNFANCYELAIYKNNKVHHYLIRHHKKENAYGIEDGLRFYDLLSLINHYHADADGLCCALVRNEWRSDGLELLASVAAAQ